MQDTVKEHKSSSLCHLVHYMLAFQLLFAIGTWYSRTRYSDITAWIINVVMQSNETSRLSNNLKFQFFGEVCFSTTHAMLKSITWALLKALLNWTTCSKDMDNLVHMKKMKYKNIGNFGKITIPDKMTNIFWSHHIWCHTYTLQRYWRYIFGLTWYISHDILSNILKQQQQHDQYPHFGFLLVTYFQELPNIIQFQPKLCHLSQFLNFLCKLPMSLQSCYTTSIGD